MTQHDVKELDKRPLLTFADNGPLLHVKIRARLAAISVSLNRLCRESNVSFSTVNNWRNGSDPKGKTVRLLEEVLLRMESGEMAASEESNEEDDFRKNAHNLL